LFIVIHPETKITCCEFGIYILFAWIVNLNFYDNHRFLADVLYIIADYFAIANDEYN